MNTDRVVTRLLAAACLSLCAMGCGLGTDAQPGAEDQVQTSSDTATASEQLASSKATYWAGDIAVLNSKQMNWSTVMEADIKTPNQASLFMTAALECGLYTSTTVKSSGGKKDTSSAFARVMTQILVDGNAAQPGPVVYCSRLQVLSATLGGILDSCTDTNGDGTITGSTECTWTDEEISLVLSTMDANSFNFIANVGQGAHHIAVQAKIDSSTTYQSGSAEADATIGKGSLVVTEQRLTR